MCIEIVKQETWAFMVVPENLKEQVTTATGVQQGGTAMLHNEYESALEKGIKEIFEKEVERICFRLITFVEIARREGILALEDKLDKEKVAKRDLFETGIQMAVDGTERAVIENYLDSWIEANCNNSVAYYEKILASIIKTGVLCIQEGYNPRIAEYKITVLIPRELTPDSLMPSSEKYFRKIKQEVGK
jgi:flagellar motor component MotA